MLRYMLAATFTLLVSACSDGSDASTGSTGGGCSWSGACGGDIVGTWDFTGECVLGQPTNDACPSWSMSMSVQLTGSVTFAADGSYSGSSNASVSEAIGFPASCLSGVTDCTSLATALQQQSGVASATCTGAPSSGCSCTVNLSPTSGSGGGTYTTSGNLLTTVSNASGTTTTRSYCVKGNTMIWNAANDDGTQVVGALVRH